MQPIFAKRKGRRIGRDVEEDAGGGQDDQGMSKLDNSTHLVFGVDVHCVSRLTTFIRQRGRAPKDHIEKCIQKQEEAGLWGHIHD